MSYRPRRRHIIIVKGIRLTELLSQPERPTKNDEDEDDAITFYDEIPREWVNGTELQQINLKCWNCDCQTTGPCAFIPMNPHYMTEDETKKIAFDRLGVYCSWPCAARDAYHRFGGRKEYPSIVHSLAEVYHMVTGVNVVKVSMAPQKNIMAEYHGNGGLTRSEYREAIRSIINEMETGER